MTPLYTAADEWFGTSTPAFHPDRTPCSADNPCGCSPDAAWACSNCGSATVAHRFCSSCEEVIRDELAAVARDLGHGWYRVAA